ncbi:MAG: N-acetylmuramoyl-L-alanine amidase [Akkermansia sp.]|nr:N-acetylmuramoyl-L-alanine amidase [Akkermansia sp.]
MNRGHIIIDIGHARGTGAKGNGMEEHARCEQIAGHLRRKLEAAGYKVTVLDFPDKINRADLVATVEAANALPCAFGISLHMDAAEQAVDVVDEDGDHVVRYIPNPKPHGAHVCYVSATGKRMAQSIARELCTLLPGRAEQVQKRSGLYILTETRAPWVLCECGFITNPEDAATEPAQIATAIANGVSHFFNS